MLNPRAARTAARALALALLTAAATRAAGAQVQANFFAPISNDNSTLAPPDPNAPFPYGTSVCTTNVGDQTGFNLDFTTTATQTFLANACGASVGQQLLHNFGARFTGSLVAPTAGMYTLNFNSDDGNVLTIDGKTVSSEWDVQAGGPGNLAVALLAGANPFVFDYFENSYGGANAILQLPDGLPAQPPPVTTTPEPATVALLGAGLLGVAAARRRRARGATA